MDIESAVERTTARVLSELGESSEWSRRESYGYPDSLALCVIDSIQSIGVRYSSVVNVLGRYRKERASADTDGLHELLATMAENSGGVEGWMKRIGNENRTSSHKGSIFKAEAIKRASLSLIGLSVTDTRSLLTLDATDLEVAKTAWRSIPGQRSGVSWRYMLMLAGAQGVKPDRMILRFLAAATGIPARQISVSDAAAVVTRAAERLGTGATDLDHAIWSWQRRHR